MTEYEYENYSVWKYRANTNMIRIWLVSSWSSWRLLVDDHEQLDDRQHAPRHLPRGQPLLPWQSYWLEPLDQLHRFYDYDDGRDVDQEDDDHDDHDDGPWHFKWQTCWTWTMSGAVDITHMHLAENKYNDNGDLNSNAWYELMTMI